MRRLLLIAVSALLATGASAEIIRGQLQIQGVGLRVEPGPVTTGIDIPTTIQTEFGGKKNDEALAVEGLLAVGDLTGPALETPIQLTTAPGHRFQIPALSLEGTYFLQNIRLMKGNEFLQPATPSVATILVADLLKTTVRVRQLSAEELRARGITVDGRNFEVYEYTFSFILDGETIEIPFPVIIDTRTREVHEVVKETPYRLPPIQNVQPPRWSPPTIIPTEFGELGEIPEAEEPQNQGEKGGRPRPRIPAAIVIPNSLAALHQFFAVVVMVTNGAPQGSTARLEDIRATIKLPPTLRNVRSEPAVAFGQPVPIVEETTGVTFLIAQAKGEAEWTLEGLKPGTHTVSFDLRATFRETGQEDVPMRAEPRASIVVHDPRFNINFAHPDTVRKGIDYSTFAFVTNTTPVEQTIRVASGVPSCDQSPGANVCRLAGTDFDELTLASGEMRAIEYKLRPGVTGRVFATAATVDTDNITAAIQLTMGVSESGIPLSPATLVMPHYAQFVEQNLVTANLQLLGLGFSLATAPLNQTTAKFPRVIRTDVFLRAVDIARAGQRIFITEGAADARRDALAHLALDLLGNGVELREWDSLRRSEKSGRGAGASVVRELEKTVASTADAGATSQFVDAFARATAHRTGYLAVLAHGQATPGARPIAVSVRGVTTDRRLDVPNEAEGGWVRDIPFGDLSSFKPAGSDRYGELALIGRWTEDVDVEVLAAASGPIVIDLIYPGSLRRAHLELSATGGQKLKFRVTSGADSIEVRSADGAFITSTTSTIVAPEPIRILGARQDLFLDVEAHKVSILFNRPIGVPAATDLRTRFEGEIDFNRDGVLFRGPRPISAAALQEDGRIVNVTFDHALSQNATYTITVGPLDDPVTSQPVSFGTPVIPKIDNDFPAGVVYGKVLKGDNTPITGADVKLRAFLPGDGPDPKGAPQVDVSRSTDGSFLFEYVRREPELGIGGGYRIEVFTTDAKYTRVDGTVRLPGRVHFVNIQFLGRGSAEGVVRYDNGEKVPGARVTVGSTMFDQLRAATADAQGFFRVEDLPVGPLTFSATDEAGNIAYAAGEISTPGEVVVQNISIFRKPFPGMATVFGVVRRSDTNAPVPAARVGVFSQGYGLVDGLTDSEGRFEFKKVPAGFVTVLASEWNISRESAAIDFDLRADETRQADLTLQVQPADTLASLTGTILRENPLFPGDSTKYERVAGALVKVSGTRVVTADAQGNFIYEAIPVSFTGRDIQVYDPSTKRGTSGTVPTLTVPNPTITILIKANDGAGMGTIRVKLLSATGAPVSGYRVLEPGFPPRLFRTIGSGVYELKNIPAGHALEVWAVSTDNTGAAPFGDQYATGVVKVEFGGHIASLTLRLPGQGTVRTSLRSDIDVIGDVVLTYPVWEESEQSLLLKERILSTNQNGLAGFAVFEKVPALGGYTVSSAHPIYGYAAHSGRLGFDRDIATHSLQLNRLATVRGTVYAIDGRTPIAGATVRMFDGRQDQGIQNTQPDGSFEFRNVAAGVAVTVVAEVTQSGIYRTGFASALTPGIGGPVDGLAVVLRRRGNVEGRVVYSGYKVFDPDNPANNVIDDTPGDLADNAPVPAARLFLRELDFPLRSFGTAIDPLIADIAGRFAINNVFVGPLRASASDPGNQELRGDWTGSLTEEGQLLTTAYIGIGSAGVGSLRVEVVDPNQGNSPVINAEVSLFRIVGLVVQSFDFATTDDTGIVEFSQLPVGPYSIGAFSKSLGKSGGANFTVQRDLTGQVRVTLEFDGSVDGKLVDPESLPPDRGIPGSHVTLTASNYQTRSTTDLQGVFLFSGVREGLFKLEAKDTETNRRAEATRNLSAADPRPFVKLELEPTETLHVAVYQPDDTGAVSNVLAGPVEVDVFQRCRNIQTKDCDYFRTLQGNPLQFPALLENEPYIVGVKEIGGEGRTTGASGSFPRGSQSDPLKLTYAAFGNVEVTVRQAGLPVLGARVSVGGGGRAIVVFTDATGKAEARGLPLGNVFAQATSVDQRFSGSASARIERQSVAAMVTIELGAFAGVTGLVEAEIGGPSVGTRVVARFGSVFEVLTDSEGRYTFQGIPTTESGTGVELVFIGPDDTTVGAVRTLVLRNDSASKVVTVPTVRLDATPPQLISIFPADAATSVSPDTSIQFVFSERIDPTRINTQHLQLLPVGESVVPPGVFTHGDGPNGTYVVTFSPPTPGLRWLRSDTLYRVIVGGGIRDLTGNSLPVPRGSSFTTSDFTEPRVIKVLPASPIPAQTTLEFRFNEPIDPTAWLPGGNGVFKLYKISANGPGGAIVADLPGNVTVDPITKAAILFGPNSPIEAESFYRVVFSGIRDLQGNVLETQTFHFTSFDHTAPFVIPVSPVPEGFALVSGVEYTLDVDIRNGSATGSTANDVAHVEYFRVDGVVETFIRTVKVAPFAYRFVAPEAPPAGSTFTLRAKAFDTSGNGGPPATISWALKPNAAPADVAIAISPAGGVYPGRIVSADVTFTDEGTLATVQADVQATRTSEEIYRESKNKQVTRAKVSDPWPPAKLDFTLPPNLKPASNATITATVTDVRGLQGTATATVTLLADTIDPSLSSVLPAPETRFNVNAQFFVEALIADGETGIAQVTFTVDGKSVAVGSTTPAGLFTRYQSAAVTVPPRNADTRIPVVVAARDFHGNTTTRSFEVVYIGVNDPTVPRATWLCPIERSALPAAQAVELSLRIMATDDIGITAVSFRVPGLADPIVAQPVAGSPGEYSARPTVNTPAAGEPFAITAVVSDADPLHTQELEIPIDIVAIEETVDGVQAITADTLARFDNRSVLVKTAGRLIPHVPVTFRNLLVLDGGKVESLASTTSTERKIDITISDRLYVDCASSIDATARGYLGGWALNSDGSGTRNEDRRGRTLGNTVTGGPTSGASASHGGLGGVNGEGESTNAAYGSLAEPLDLGAGGSGSPTCCTPGGQGGGAIRVRGATGADELGRIVIAGSVRADGAHGSAWRAGAGGSVLLSAREVIAGPGAHITANGGDDDGGNVGSWGAGGGRVAIVAAERLQLEADIAQARGGRNVGTADIRSALDGGAGTIYVRRPGQLLGELIVSSRDERFPQTLHLTRPTPFYADVSLDALSVGPRALARFDADLMVPQDATTIDATAVLVRSDDKPAITLTTLPAPGSSLIRASKLKATRTAESIAGVGSVALIPSFTATITTKFSDYPASVPSAITEINVAADAPLGPATLKARATDRAERTFELDSLQYTIVENQPPVISRFDVTPESLQVYPGATVAANVGASDDLEVKRVTLSPRIGETALPDQVRTVNAPLANEIFNVPIAITTPGGSTLTLQITVADDFPSRPGTTATKSVSIRHDTGAPQVAIVSPSALTPPFQEGGGNTITILATATDAEVGVKEVFAQIDGGPQIPLTATTGNQYTAAIPVPNVDGFEIVTKQLTVTGADYANNRTTAPAVTIQIIPLNDPNAPTAAWACGSVGTMYPPAHAAKLRIFAKGATTANAVQKVEFYIDGSTTPVLATAVSGLADHYETTYAIPDRADGSEIDVRALATSIAGNTTDISSKITVVTSTIPAIAADLTINSANAATYEGKTVIVQSGTVTVEGLRTFARLVVLGGAKVVHKATNATTIERLQLTVTGDAYVACDGSIDSTGRGLIGNSGGLGFTYGAAVPALTGGSAQGAGGSHGGRGANHTGVSAASYGSLFDPDTPGGAAGSNSGACATCGAGGGIIRLRARRATVDGKIIANGDPQAFGSVGIGAGGSIRLDVETLGGAGEVRADGGSRTCCEGAGGGGRVALYYQTLGFDRSRITAAAGTNGSGVGVQGSAGTVYLRRIDGTGEKVHDELVISNRGRGSNQITTLPALGTGALTAVNGAVLTLSAAVPAWVEASWIEFHDGTGQVTASYEITARTSTTVTVKLPTGESAATVPVGSTYRGVWRFDQITATQLGVLQIDSARVPLLSANTATSAVLRIADIRGDAVRLQGGSIQSSTVRVTDLSLREGAVLTHPRATSTTVERLRIDVDVVTIDNTSAIDVTGKGLVGNSGGIGYTYAAGVPTLTGSAQGAGGSHGGRGANHDGTSAASYGSLFDPDTPGSAAGSRAGACATCGAGGGVIRLRARSVTVDGKIVANGDPQNVGSVGMGAGGSVRLAVETLSGAGEIRADGASRSCCEGAGGGGRVALYYQMQSIDRSRITAAGGANGTGGVQGSAGTVYLRQLNQTGEQVRDELVIDNVNRASNQVTTLASLGTGAVTAVNGAVLTLSTTVPSWIEGSWIEISDATGQLIAAYQITARTPTTVTVKLLAGETSAQVPVGSSYRGVWRFEQVTVTQRGVLQSDTIRTPLLTANSASGAVMRIGEVRGDAVTLQGGLFESSAVRVTNLTLRQGAVLTHPPTTATTIHRLSVEVAEGLSVDATSSIDATARGLGGNTGGIGYTYAAGVPTLAGGSTQGAGGSHGGRGAHYTGTAAQSYGSLFDPDTPGGAAGATAGACASCAAGGGVIRVRARSLTLDGKIVANGDPQVFGSVGTGAGGSVRLDVETLSGAGEVRANGASRICCEGSGGGGRVAIYYQSLGVDRSRITAAGGANGSGASVRGAPGTVYLKSPAQSFGELIVDNGSVISPARTRLTSVGLRTVDEVGTDFVRDIGASLPIPDQLRGISIFLNNDRTVRWPILSNTAEVVRVDTTGQALTATAGQSFRGIQKFDTIRLRNANVEIEDVLESVATIDKDAVSSIVGNNQGVPTVDPTKISISNGALGPVMIGAAGAVADPDQPITVFAQNQNSGQAFSVTAAADGSFTILLRGSTGDSISVFARDGSVFPLQSQPVFIGTLPSANVTPVAVPITPSMTTDTNFRARRLAFDGNTLVAQTYPATVDNNKLLVFDISSGTPAWVQTITVPSNTRDVVVKNNVAYVTTAANFYAYDLAVNPAIRQQASFGCTDSLSVAVDRTYAYVGSNCTDGRINIYDITNPKVPVFLRQQGTGVSGITYTQLIPYGSYLIAVTPNGGTSGPDVVMIDRRDINNLVKVWEMNIAGFTGFRASVQGTTLYVSGLEGSLAIMDVSVPTLAVVKSVFAAAPAAHGVSAVGSLAFLAADTSGLIGIDATDPLAPTGAGGIATSPQAAWDVVIRGQLGIIAAEDRLLTFTAAVPPQVDASKISISFDGHSATVQAAQAAILGAQPLTVEVRDETSGAMVSGVAVAANGSFSATIAASSGDAISVVATDANGATSGVVRVGVVPFGSSATLVPITAAMANGDLNFRARHLAIDGTTLAAINYPIGGTDTNKLLILDITSGTPVLSQTITVPANTRDVVVKNNVAYVATSGNFYVYDLTVNPATRQQASFGCTDSFSVAVDGAYAYVGSNCTDGRINIYDITNPKAPVFLRQQGTGVSGITYTQLIPHGNYLIAITPNGGASGADVVVIDRRDINNLVKVSSTSIPGIVGFRGTVLGQTLYMAGEGTNAAMAVIDLTNVASPTFVVTPTVGGSRGVAVAGNLAAFGDGSAGVTFFDVSTPTAPRLVGTQNVGGMSWDVRFAGGKLYAAVEQGIAVIHDVIAPPVVDVSRITITHGTTATVSGSAGAVTGAATPITLQVKNDTSGTTVNDLAVGADGSFTASIAAVSGDAISVVATDANGATSGVVRVGVVPFGSSATLVPITAAMANGDLNFRARHLAIDGTTLAAINYPIGGTDTNKLLIFDITSGTPVLSQTITVPANTRDVVVKNNVAYVATSGNFYVYDLTVNPATRQQASFGCTDSFSVAVDGAYAYVGSNCTDGRINIYDITNPKAPVFLRQQGTGVSGITYTQLIPYGNYLIAITPNGGVSGADVVVIDRRDINNLVKVSATSIGGIVGFRGTVLGQTLYMAGEGTNAAMAIVDLTNVASPTFVVTPTVGGSRGLAVAGNLAAFGDGAVGVTFFDVSSSTAPRLVGTQNVGGMSWDVRFAGGKLYAAVEQGIAVIHGVTAPPVVDVSRITITNGTTVTVSGSATTVTGSATPITLQVKNDTTGTTVNDVAVGTDGSFSASIAAVSGDAISVVATDANGAPSGVFKVGIVPFGTVVQVPTLSLASGDVNFRARHLAIDGTTLAAVNYPTGGTDTNKLLIFDIASGTPVLSQTITVPANTRDVVVKNNVAYVATAANFYAYDLTVNPATRQQASFGCTDSFSVAVDGAYAFVGSNCGDGRINIYDIANPKAPVFLRQQGTGVSAITYTQLIPFGNYLIAITPNGGASGVDVVVIDRSDINNLVKVSATSIAGIVGFRGTVLGQTLYMAGEGTNAAMAVVDLTNVTLPTFVVTPTVGGSRGVAVTGNLAVFGDGSPGVTFFDVTNINSPRLVGTQNIGGMSWDVASSGGKLYVASEQMINVIDLAGTGSALTSAPVVQSVSAVLPPEPAWLRIDRARISVFEHDGTFVVRGAAGTLTGPRPISIEIKNMTLGTSVPMIALSENGSFETMIGAVPGDHLILEATSGIGERVEVDLGLIQNP